MSDYPAFLVHRFWSKVEKSPEPNGCWLWTGATNSVGYGNFYVRRLSVPSLRDFPHTMLAHRFAWTIDHGHIPEGLNVLHTPPCTNRRCVRHIYLGTQQNNVDDMTLLGRRNDAKGSAHPKAKYPEAVVQALLDDYAAGLRDLRTLVKKYGLPYTTVSSIVHRYAWKHLSAPALFPVPRRRSPLTREQVHALREGFLSWSGSMKSYAQHVEMKYNTVRCILKGINWKDA